MKTDDSILEVCFLIRSYGKGELAMCYIHGVTQQAAVNRFNTWIDLNASWKFKIGALDAVFSGNVNNLLN